MIDNIEIRSLHMQCKDEDDFLPFLNTRFDGKGQFNDDHTIILDNQNYTFEIYNKHQYLKLSLANAIWPLKMKVHTYEGTSQLFVSFLDKFPDADNTIKIFEEKREILCQFNRPTKFKTEWFYIKIQSKDLAKIQLKCWFTDANLEKWRYHY